MGSFGLEPGPPRFGGPGLVSTSPGDEQLKVFCSLISVVPSLGHPQLPLAEIFHWHSQMGRVTYSFLGISALRCLGSTPVRSRTFCFQLI